MNTVEQRLSRENHDAAYGAPVPAARPLNEFCTERVGDDVVLFDSSRDRYHTLNSLAFDIWRLCDGTRSIERIGSDLDRSGIANEAVISAIAELGESGLLQAPEDAFEATLHRRRLMKLAAAGVIGTVGIPVVASITRLGPEASATHEDCVHGGSPCSATGDPPCCGGFPCQGDGYCPVCHPPGTTCMTTNQWCCTGEQCVPTKPCP